MPASCADVQFRSHAAGRLVRDYLDFKVHLGFTSYATSVARVAQSFDDFIAELAIADVRQLDEAALLNWVYGQPSVSDHGKNDRIRFLKGFCRYLLRRRVLSQDPARGISFVAVRAPRPYIYSLREIDQILQGAASFEPPVGPTLYTLFFLLYACGLRLGEALALRVQDIDWEEATLSLWNTKFHKERLVPFCPAVARLLRKYLRTCRKRRPTPKPTDRLFAVLKQRFPKPIVERHFRQIRRRLNLEPTDGTRAPRLHDLRHTFAVHRLYKWYQEGAHPLNKLPLLSTYMGHVSIEHTQVYLTITQDLLREGDSRFQQSFEAVTKPSLRRALKRS